MSSTPECPTDEELRSFAQGTCDTASVVPICEHLDHCDSCESRICDIESTAPGFLQAVRDAQSQMTVQGSSANAPLPISRTSQEQEAIRSAGIVIASANSDDSEDDYSSMLEYLGKKFGPFRIRSILGSGGMGSVFRARHEMMERDVALKIIHPSKTQDPKVQRRFLREMVAAGQVDHENIVQALDANEIDGVHYLAMKYAPGKTVRELISGGRCLSVPVACEIARQVAVGLQHVHQSGLVHRDIKPSNVIVTVDASGRGQAKILDLGLARLTAEDHNFSKTRMGSVLGTANYMSPEQADGNEVDARSDLYSLGVMLYRMLAGRLPYPVSSNSSEAAVLASVLRDEPRRLETGRPETGGELADLVHQSLRKIPEQRPHDCAEFAHRLESFARPLDDFDASISVGSVADSQGDQVPEPPPTPTGGFRSPSSIAWTLIALLVIGSAAFIVSKRDIRSAINASTQSGSPPGSVERNDRSDRDTDASESRSMPAENSVWTPSPVNGFVASDYHPTAPSDRILEFDFRGRPYDEETLTVHYEAPPGNYQFRLRPDDRGLLASDRIELLFYANGDRGAFNAEFNRLDSRWLAKVPMPAAPEVQFNVVPGTQKISVVPSWNLDLVEKMGTRRIPNTQTVCILYCYPDLTYANAQISPERVYAGTSFNVAFDVVNCGVVKSEPGVAYVRLDPIGKETRSIVGKFTYGGLEPGEHETIKESIATSPFQVPMDYVASIIIDAKDSTIERDELSHGSWKQNSAKPFIPASDLENLVPYNNEYHCRIRVIAAD